MRSQRFSMRSERSETTRTAGSKLSWKVRYRTILWFFSQMSKLYRARSLLYRRQILQENIRWKALDEIYKIYMLLHRSDLNISENVRQTFSHFSNEFCQKKYEKSLTKHFWNIEVWAVQSHATNLVDLVKSFPTNMFLENLASIQKRTSPMKLDHLAEKSV